MGVLLGFFAFTPIIEITTMFSFSSKNQNKRPGAVTENPCSIHTVKQYIQDTFFFYRFFGKKMYTMENSRRTFNTLI